MAHFVRRSFFGGVVLCAVVCAVVYSSGPHMAVAAGNIVVDSTGDADSRDGVVTLREAILLATGDLAVATLDAGEANNVTGAPGAGSADIVRFSPAIFPPAAPEKIVAATALPWLKSGGDAIDGTGAGVMITGASPCLTLRNSNGNVVRRLQVDGCTVGIYVVASTGNVISEVVLTGNGTGIYFDTGGSSNRVEKSLIGTNSAGSLSEGNVTGIKIDGASNQIGGADPALGNVVSGNTVAGISADEGVSALVQNNFIGTAANGETSIPNLGDGITLGGSENPRNWTIRDNVISGNLGNGIRFGQGGGHVIAGNQIGVKASGLPLGNGGHGIWRNGLPTGAVVTIGGTLASDANVIGANAGHGISLELFANGNAGSVLGNYIGVTDTGASTPNGLSGIFVWAQNLVIGSVSAGGANVIAHNQRYGVEFDDDFDSEGNTVRGNSIYGNTLGGILSPVSAIQYVVPPVVQSAGSASGTSCGSCVIDVFSDAAAQGRIYEGTTTADVGGNWNFTGAVQGPSITATATAADGTSEFSAPFDLDADNDGIGDPVDNCPAAANPLQENQDADEWGDVCESVSCVTVATAWFTPPGDADCDGYPSTSAAAGRAPEAFLGTDPGDTCANTLAPNNEPPPDAWPVDFDDNQRATIIDVSNYSGRFGAMGPNPPYGVRYDLNGDFRITILDVSQYSAFFGRSCSP